MLFLGKTNRRKKKVIEDEESEVPHVEKTTNGLQMIIFFTHCMFSHHQLMVTFTSPNGRFC